MTDPGVMDLYVTGGLLALAFIVLLWAFSLIIKDASIIDIFWGPGFVLLAFVYFLGSSQPLNPHSGMLLLLVSLWGLRLGGFILLRNWGAGEDYRYQKWRENTGPAWWWRSFFKVFLLQGFLMWLISAPLALAFGGPGKDLVLLDYIAVFLWLVGFSFEAGGDCQLMRFKKIPENAGRVLDHGFWRYSRHPNYFGDALQWWAFFLLSLSSSLSGFWTIYSPVLMTFLLVRISGVALLERSLVETKPEYADYISRTAAFVPWFPRDDKNR